jgi:stage II sporulation protein GA (sporulation sigma-E factor processing peptidase)
MIVNGELFALVNTLANGLSLWLAARLLGGPLPEWKRIFQAALCGAVYGVAAFWPGLSILRTIPFVLFSTILMAKILFPHLRPLLTAKAALLILLCGLLMGGFLSWLVRQGISPWLAFGALFLSMAGTAFFCGIRIKVPSRVTMVEIALDGCSMSPKPVRLPAMLDTGNQLTDPITGLPVVVASSSSLKPLLPAAVKPDNPETLPVGFRFLRVQTTAGHKMMMCFRPTHFRVQLEGIWYDSQVLIAIAPTGYDGAQALVPAAVVEAL